MSVRRYERDEKSNRGHHVSALTVTSCGRSVGSDMARKRGEYRVDSRRIVGNTFWNLGRFLSRTS